jgi:micrococcal nuclease
MKKIIIGLCISLLTCFFTITTIFGGSNLENCYVERVVDGDTAKIIVNGKAEKVRFLMIDTPESVHPDQSKNVPMGKIVSDYTKDKLQGKYVRLEMDKQERDKYGRLLAYVYINGEMFNKELVRIGYAKVLMIKPNGEKYASEFYELETKAKEQKLGMWAKDNALEN